MHDGTLLDALALNRRVMIGCTTALCIVIPASLLGHLMLARTALETATSQLSRQNVDDQIGESARDHIDAQPAAQQDSEGATEPLRDERLTLHEATREIIWDAVNAVNDQRGGFFGPGSDHDRDAALVAEFIDAYGHHLRYVDDPDGKYGSEFYVESSGPDGVFGNADDMRTTTIRDKWRQMQEVRQDYLRQQWIELNARRRRLHLPEITWNQYAAGDYPGGHALPPERYWSPIDNGGEDDRTGDQ